MAAAPGAPGGPAQPAGGGREGAGPAPAGAEGFSSAAQREGFLAGRPPSEPASTTPPTAGEPSTVPGLLGTAARDEERERIATPADMGREPVPPASSAPADGEDYEPVIRYPDDREELPPPPPPLRTDAYGAPDGEGALGELGFGGDHGEADAVSTTGVDSDSAGDTAPSSPRMFSREWFKAKAKERAERQTRSAQFRGSESEAARARAEAEKTAAAERERVVKQSVEAEEAKAKTAAERAAELGRAQMAVDLVVVGEPGGSFETLSPEMQRVVGEAQRALFKSIDASEYAVVEGEDYQAVNAKDLRSEYVGKDVREKQAARQTEQAKTAAEQTRLQELRESYKVVVSGNDIYLVSEARGVTIGSDGAFALGEYEMEEQVMDYNTETGENDIPRFDDDDNPVMRPVKGKGHADISVVSFTPREAKDARSGRVYETYSTASVVGADDEGRLKFDEKGRVDRTKPESLEALFAEAATSPIELKLDQWSGIDIVDIGQESADQAKATNRRILDTDRYMDEHEEERGLIVGAGAEAVRRGLIKIDRVDSDLQWLGPERKGTEGTLQLALSDDQMDQYDLLTTAQQRAFVRTLGLPAGYNLDKRGVNPVSSTDTDPDDFSSLRIQAGDSGKDVRRGLSGQAAENLGRNRDLLALGRDQDDEARVVVERARGNSDVYAAALVIAAQRGKEGYTDPFDVIKEANGDLAAIQEAFGERTKGIAGDVSRLDIARDIIAEKLGIEGDRLDGGVLADQFAERLAETIGRRTQIQELNHLLTLPRQTVDGQPEAFDAWTGRIKDGLRSLGVDPTKVDSLVDAIHQPEVVPAEGNAVISGIAREVMSAHATSEDPRTLRDRLLADIQAQADAGTLTGDDLAEARRAVDEFAPEPVAPPSQTELFGSTMRQVMGAESVEEAVAILRDVEGQLDPADAAILRGQIDAKRPPVPEQPDQALVDAAVNLLARQLGISEEAARAMLRNQAQTTGGTT